MDLEQMFQPNMDMDSQMPVHPGLQGMASSLYKQEQQSVPDDEALQLLLRKAQQMYPDWPPIAQYMWAQGQIQNFQSNKQVPKSGQLFTNPNFRMTY